MACSHSKSYFVCSIDVVMSVNDAAMSEDSSFRCLHSVQISQDSAFVLIWFYFVVSFACNIYAGLLMTLATVVQFRCLICM